MQTATWTRAARQLPDSASLRAEIDRFHKAVGAAA